MLIDDKVEISEEYYNKIMNADKEAASEMMINIAIKSGYNPVGYGYYSPLLYKSGDGKYIFRWTHSDSCD